MSFYKAAIDSGLIPLLCTFVPNSNNPKGIPNTKVSEEVVIGIVQIFAHFVYSVGPKPLALPFGRQTEHSSTPRNIAKSPESIFKFWQLICGTMAQEILQHDVLSFFIAQLKAFSGQTLKILMVFLDLNIENVRFCYILVKYLQILRIC
jgi:hypothetical protein